MKLPGWTKLSPCVFEHQDGTRIHLSGLALLPDGREVWGSRWPESKRVHHAIRRFGGNRRRGLMYWSRHMLPIPELARPPASGGSAPSALMDSEQSTGGTTNA